MANIDSRVTIHMAASLDGFIARKDGRVDWIEISEKLRQLSARLRSAITALPFHELMRLFQLVPSQERIQEAAARLVRMSNLLLETEQKRHDEIRQDMAAIGALLQIDVAKEK